VSVIKIGSLLGYEAKNKVSVLFILCFLNVYATSTWFVHGYTITNNDLAYPLYPREELLERFSLFSQQRGLGVYLGNNLAGTPQRFIEFLLLNLSPNYGQRIEFTVLNLLISLSAVYLLRSFFAIYSTRYSSIITVLVALTQTWSLYLAFVWVRLQTVIFVLIFLQFALALLVRVFSSTLQIRGFLIRISFLSIALGWSLGTQPPILAIVVVVFFFLVTSFGLFQAKNNDFSLQTIVKISGFSSLLYIGLNVWWIYPLVKYSTSNDFFNRTVLEENFDVKNQVLFTSSPTSIFNSLRQLGDFAWFGDYWPELRPWLFSTPYVLASFLIPFVLVRGISKLSKANGTFNTFALTAGSFILIISTFLTLGSFGPTGELYKWSLDNVPLFSLQRAPWQKFTIMIWLFSPALLFYSLIDLKTFNCKRLHKNFVSLTVSFLLIISIVFSPMSLVARGEMFSKSWNNLDGYHERNNFGFHLKIPNYVFSASNYLTSKGFNSDLLILPDSITNNYDWGWGAPWDITWQTVRAGIASRNYGEGLLPPSATSFQTSIDKIYEDLVKSDFSQAAQRMEILGIDKILVRGDFNRNFILGSALEPINDQDEVEAWNQLLIRADMWSNIEIFGPWTVYQLDQVKFPLAQSFYLQEIDPRNAPTSEILSKLVKQTHFRNIQGSFQKIETPSILDVDKVTLKENTSRYWKVYSYEKIRDTADNSAAYLPWYSNLFFSASILLNDLPWISDLLQQSLGIEEIKELSQLNATQWQYSDTKISRTGVLASFHQDRDLVVGCIATFLFTIILMGIFLFPFFRKSKLITTHGIQKG